MNTPGFLVPQIKELFPDSAHPVRKALKKGTGFTSILQNEIKNTEDIERKKSLKHINKQLHIAKKFY